MNIENEPAAKEAETLTGDALTIAFLKANLEDLRTGGIVTVAMTNPNVMSYMEHWEGRAEKAEKRAEELEATLRAHNSDSAEPVAWRWRSPRFQDGWWQMTDVPPTNPQDHIEYQPLYLASPPAKEVERLRTALHNLAEAVDMFNGVCSSTGCKVADRAKGEMSFSLSDARRALTNRTPDDEVGNG